MQRATMDPAEAVAHLVAHDIRAPIFLAAELLRMTADDGRANETLAEVTGRLDAVVNGLQAAGAICDDVVGSLRPKPPTVPDGPIGDLAASLWPTSNVVITGSDGDTALLSAVLRDLAAIAPAPTKVQIDLSRPPTCQVRASGIDDGRDACLALARTARRVRALELDGGDFRTGREGNEFVIDVRFPPGGDGP